MKYLRKPFSHKCKDVHVASKYWWMFKDVLDLSWKYFTSADNTTLEEAFRDVNTCNAELRDIE